MTPIDPNLAGRLGIYRGQMYLGWVIIGLAAVMIGGSLIGSDRSWSAVVDALNAGIIPLLMGTLAVVAGRSSMRIGLLKHEIQVLQQEVEQLRKALEAQISHKPPG